MLSEWEEVNISLGNFTFWWDTWKTLEEYKEKIIRACFPWLELYHVQMSAYRIPNHSICTKSLLHWAMVLTIASCFLPLALCGRALRWDFTCSGDDLPGILTPSRPQENVCPPCAHLPKWQRVPTKDLKWSLLRKKHYTPHCHWYLFTQIPTFYTVPPPSANLHLKTHNQIEGCEWGYSRLVREKLIPHNTVQPALQSLVVLLLREIERCFNRKT